MKLAAVGALALAGCLSSASSNVSETRMIQAPPLPPTCPLQLVSVDITAMSFHQTWEVLGYVTLLDQTDPNAPANHDLVRPRACAMGGTAVALAMASTSGPSGGIVYMVMHPKPAPANGSVTF